MTLPGRGYSPCALTTRLTSNASTRRSPTVTTTHSRWRKRCGTSFTTPGFGEALLTENGENPRKRKRKRRRSLPMLFPNRTSFLEPSLYNTKYIHNLYAQFFSFTLMRMQLFHFGFTSSYLGFSILFFLCPVFRWSFSGCVKFCARFLLCKVLSTLS